MNVDAFIDRILELVVNPAHEWEKIREEDIDDPWQFLLKYIALAIFINAACYFIGTVFVGAKIHGVPDTQYLSGVRAFFASAFLVIAYTGVIFAGAMIVKLIATSFDSKDNASNAFKLVAFSLYPLLVFGSLHIIPTLKAGALVGSYGVYLLYTGFPVLLDTPKEKSASFTLVVSLTIIGMLALAFALINTISGAGFHLRVGV